MERISRETIRQWLGAMAIKPHRSRYWLNRPDPDYDAKMREMVDFYVDPSANPVVLCFGERPGIQALQR